MELTFLSKIFNKEAVMNINRDKYLNDLINRMHNGMIKVVTGECVNIGLNQEKPYK